MAHILSILCLLIFIYFLEIRIKHELMEVEHEFKILKEEILKNREKIEENEKIISKIK
nr:MAG TPA: hypothetical protein [Bacteriophage sp.]